MDGRTQVIMTMGTPEIIAEDQVAPATIESLFRRALFRTTLDDDGDVCVETDDPVVFVSINVESTMNILTNCETRASSSERTPILC